MNAEESLVRTNKINYDYTIAIIKRAQSDGNMYYNFHPESLLPATLEILFNDGYAIKGVIVKEDRFMFRAEYYIRVSWVTNHAF